MLIYRFFEINMSFFISKSVYFMITVLMTLLIKYNIFLKIIKIMINEIT